MKRFSSTFVFLTSSLFFVGCVSASTPKPAKGMEYLVERARLEIKYAYINSPLLEKTWGIGFSELSSKPSVIPFVSDTKEFFVAVVFGLANPKFHRGIDVVFQVCPDGSEHLLSYGGILDIEKTVSFYKNGPFVGYEGDKCLAKN